MTVLLVNPPGLTEPSGQTHASESFIAGQKRRLRQEQYYSLPFEHLGVMSIAAYARSRGLEVDTVDGVVAGHSSLEQTLRDIGTAVARSGPPLLIGFSGIDTFDEVVWLATECRRAWPDAKIAIGNTFATLNCDRILRAYDCFDFVFVGEGEVGVALLAEAVGNCDAIEDIPGLARRGEAGAVRRTPSSSIDLDDLPWPARDQLPTVLREGFAAAVFTTRGCPYRCTFCGTGATSGLLGGRKGYRIRAIEDVVDEIEYLVSDFCVDFVSITDDLFLAKPEFTQARAASFASELIRRKLKVGFMFDARLDAIYDLKLLAHLKQAGLRRVFIGVETGSHEQLRSYKKKHILAGADPAGPINALQEIGIEVVPGTIMFHPEVRPPELRETLRVLKATGYKAPAKLIERITAHVGTPLYYEYSAKGYLTKDWPVGEWAFVDPNADRTYEQLVRRVRDDDKINFDAAEEFFLAKLAEWEAAELAASAHAHRPDSGQTR